MRAFNILIMVLIIGLFLTYTKAEGADWKLYSKNKMIINYYDIESIVYPSKNIVRVWTKMISSLFSGISHTLYLNEVDCSERLIRKIERIPYVSVREMKNRPPPSEPLPLFTSWRHITPETAAESLYKAVCSQLLRNEKKKEK